MVRSWDARVRGATGRVSGVSGLDASDETSEDTQDTPSSAQPGPPMSLSGPPMTLSGPPMTLSLQAIMASAGVAGLIVDRSSGSVLWASQRWTQRFDERSTFAAHLRSTTNLGEVPLPQPGESWARTMSLLRSDGTEELTGLRLDGTAGQDASYVAIFAQEQTTKSSPVSDRTEVLGILGGALELSSGDAQQVGVLYIDLDRFKVVHDLVGGLETIRLLDLVGRRIREVLEPQSLLLRLPSDEFVVVLNAVDSMAAAENSAESVREAVATLRDIGHDLALTTSVGVALNEVGQSGEELLAAAETAVYLAKGRGRNRVAVHDEELRARSQRLLVVERQLRKSIDRREVKFAYQPVVDMRSGAVVGAEALLRLGGEVGLSAMEVIQAAEHSGLMGALGALVLDGVDDQLSDLIRSPVGDFEVMINLSQAQLNDDYLLSTLARLAADRSIRDGRLAVEVPEAVVVEHPEAFAELAKIVRPRFKLGIDGFGTLVSSPELLKSPAVDYVKLHRTITASAGVGQSIAELVKLAGRADVKLVALGVENAEQATALQASGCSLAQGFLYVGAVACEDLLELISVGFGLGNTNRHLASTP